MLISLILIFIEKPGTKIKKTNAHLNFDQKWVNVTLLLHFFENHPYKFCCLKCYLAWYFMLLLNDSKCISLINYVNLVILSILNILKIPQIQGYVANFPNRKGAGPLPKIAKKKSLSSSLKQFGQSKPNVSQMMREVSHL